MRTHYATVSVSPSDIATMARQIEDDGYDSLWTSEVQYDPFIGLAVAAQATDHIELRTGIAVAFARNPMTTAVLANDLQLLSQGRFALGLGSQLKAHITRRFSMPWSEPAARMREYVLALRTIWDSFGSDERLRFRGKFYRHTLRVPFFDPGPNPFGPPPVYLAGVGELMTEVAGEMADGFIMHNVSSRRFFDEVSLPALERGRAKAGKTMEGFAVFAAPIVATGRDEAEVSAASRRARQQIAFYASTPTYAKLLEVHGLHDVRSELHRLQAAGRIDEMASVIDDGILNTFAAVGGPEEVAATLQENFGDVVDSISFYDLNITDPAHWLPTAKALRALDRPRLSTVS